MATLVSRINDLGLAIAVKINLRAPKADPVFTGVVTTPVLKTTAADAIRVQYGATAPSVIHRKDTTNYYIMLSDTGAPDGPWNALRPFSISLTTGSVSMSNGVSVGGGLIADSLALNNPLAIGQGGTGGTTAAAAATALGLGATSDVNFRDVRASRAPTLGAYYFGTADNTHYLYYNGSTYALMGGTGFTYNGATIWHSGNDGVGSGLDADLLDGYNAASLPVSTPQQTALNYKLDLAGGLMTGELTGYKTGTVQIRLASPDALVAGKSVGISFDPTANGPGVRDAQIRGISISGGTDVGLGFYVANGSPATRTWLMHPGGSLVAEGLTPQTGGQINTLGLYVNNYPSILSNGTINTPQLNATFATVGGATFSSGQIRLSAGGYGAIIRNDGSTVYFLLTNVNDSDGGWNALRPLAYSVTTGIVSIGNGLNVAAGMNVAGGFNVTSGVATFASSVTTTGLLTTNAGLTSPVNINANGGISMGAATGQRINLYSTAYGIGIQSSTTYIRTGSYFAIHAGGVHSDTALDPGTGGTKLFEVSGSTLKYLTNNIYHTGNKPTAADLGLGSTSTVTFGDINTIRSASPTTGAIYFGNQSGTSRYLFFDGSAFQLVGGTLNAPNVALTGGLTGVNISLTGSITLNGTGVIQIPDGTAAAPSLRFTADTNCGIYRHADDRVGIAANGAARASIGSVADFFVNITSTGTITGSSDRRWKTDIKPIENALEKVCLMQGMNFKHKQSGLADAGVIAQDQEFVTPELIIHSGDDEDRLFMNYNGLTGYLIEAIKELKAEIEDLKKRVV